MPFPFWLTLSLLLSLGSVGLLGTMPNPGQNRKNNAEQKLLQRKDAQRHTALAQEAQAMGQLVSAVFHWHQAEAVYTYFKDWDNLNITLSQLVLLHQTQGNSSAAEAVLRQQLRLARKREDHSSEVQVLEQLAHILAKQEQYQIAESILADAKAIAAMQQA